MEMCCSTVSRVEARDETISPASASTPLRTSSVFYITSKTRSGESLEDGFSLATFSRENQSSPLQRSSRTDPYNLEKHTAAKTLVSDGSRIKGPFHAWIELRRSRNLKPFASGINTGVETVQVLCLYWSVSQHLSACLCVGIGKSEV